MGVEVWIVLKGGDLPQGRGSGEAKWLKEVDLSEGKFGGLNCLRVASTTLLSFTIGDLAISKMYAM